MSWSKLSENPDWPWEYIIPGEMMPDKEKQETDVTWKQEGATWYTNPVPTKRWGNPTLQMGMEPFNSYKEGLFVGKIVAIGHGYSATLLEYYPKIKGMARHVSDPEEYAHQIKRVDDQGNVRTMFSTLEQTKQAVEEAIHRRKDNGPKYKPPY